MKKKRLVYSVVQIKEVGVMTLESKMGQWAGDSEGREGTALPPDGSNPMKFYNNRITESKLRPNLPSWSRCQPLNPRYLHIHMSP